MPHRKDSDRRLALHKNSVIRTHYKPHKRSIGRTQWDLQCKCMRHFLADSQHMKHLGCSAGKSRILYIALENTAMTTLYRECLSPILWSFSSPISKQEANKIKFLLNQFQARRDVNFCASDCQSITSLPLIPAPVGINTRP